MKILVLTLSFGSGHVRAAQAVADELSRQVPASKVLVVDALEECRWLFRAGYEWPYWLMLRYAPGLWDRFSTARVNQKHEGTAPAARMGLSSGLSESVFNYQEFQSGSDRGSRSSGLRNGCDRETAGANTSAAPERDHRLRV